MIEDLADELRRMAVAVENLPDPARARLSAAVMEADCVLALNELRALIDPTGEMSRWAAAAALEHRLARFESAAARRIRDGQRPPRNALEACLARVSDCATAPRSRRRIFSKI